ncbi:MAG: MGMT family protein [Theionarchaea archaeon]|nr:MGMT family protein [Theionarchaea archaeon]MBU7000019.1 MGMT family protein [Theionarchaea archaeon]MBU7021683.1 MGMT family protein [Theionarchaea archaeon]MBU7035015.1 MGMT family protein [Theionarchaea archaeon]MBU7040325.1 MGMT family protein [Theionarchaea archaeon]
MNTGTVLVDGIPLSVVMNGKIKKILIGVLPEGHPLTPSEEAQGLAERLKAWVEKGEVFSYPFEVSGTPFQQAVYEAIQKIPRGKVSTYKGVAEKIGSRAFRAVGQALHSNPVPFLVPCHRVIGSDRTLTGFGGGVDLKKRILEHEGVEFEGGKVKKAYILKTF